MPSELTPWPDTLVNGAQKPRTAGVSVFGFGGANAHLVFTRAHSSFRAY